MESVRPLKAAPAAAPKQRDVPARATVPRPAPLTLPLPHTLANALPWTLSVMPAGLAVTAADLADPGFAGALNAQEATAVVSELQARLKEALRRGEPPLALQTTPVHWARASLDFFTARSRAQLIKTGWGRSRACRETALASLLPAIGADDVGLLRLLLAEDRRATRPSDPAQAQIAEPARLQHSEIPQAWRATSPQRWVELSDGARIGTGDVRFGWWLSQVLAAPGCERSERLAELGDVDRARWTADQRHAHERLVAGLAAADGLSVADEIAAIAAAAMRSTRNVARSVRLVMLRYGADGLARSLDEVSAAMGEGLTRQAIHVTLKLGIERCGAGAHAPAIRRLIDRLAPTGAGDYALKEQALRDGLGPTQALDGAVNFARDFLGVKTAWRVVSSHSRGNGVTTWQAHRSPKLDRILQCCHRLARQNGAVHWSSVSALVSCAEGGWVDRRDFDDAVQGHVLLHWLDREHGWVTFADATESTLHRNLTAMLLAAQAKGLAFASLFAGACRAHQVAVGGEAIPPAHVVKALLDQSDCFDARGDGFVLKTAQPVVEPDWGTAIAALLRAIAQHGGLASREEIESTCSDRSPTAAAERRRLLDTLPMIEAVGPDFFAVRGRMPSRTWSPPGRVRDAVRRVEELAHG